MTALGNLAKGVQTFVCDVAQGFFEITHNGFAVVGLAVVFSVLTLAARPDLRFDATAAGQIFLLNKADGTIRVTER